MTTVEPRALNMTDSAAYLGISRATLWRLITAGAIPVIVIGDTEQRPLRRIARADLDDFIDRQRAS